MKTGHRFLQTRSLIFKVGIILPIVSVGFFGCNRSGQKDSSQYSPDNSGKNQRDASAQTLTPEDQKGNSVDLDIVQKIRQAIVADNSFSMNAKNIKIVAVNGMVTLRGPVDNIQEKQNIESKAGHIVGMTKIDNQLEAKSE